MSKTIKFAVSDDNYASLEAEAKERKLCIQEYIRWRLFPDQVPFTPRDAAEKALSDRGRGETFTLPKLYGDAWTLPNGMAGQFGKKFFALVEKEYKGRIKFNDEFDERKNAVYIIL